VFGESQRTRKKIQEEMQGLLSYLSGEANQNREVIATLPAESFAKRLGTRALMFIYAFPAKAPKTPWSASQRPNDLLQDNLPTVNVMLP